MSFPWQGAARRLRTKGRIDGFTLIELISVIAILAVLAAILIPSVASVRVSANKAKTRVQFAQWAAAIEAFRNEYGYYPAFDNSSRVNGGVSALDHIFHDVLAARRRDGSALVSGGTAAAQNRKLISFYTFPESDFTPADSLDAGLLCDALGNTDIAVLVDRNLDGAITLADAGGALPLVNGIRPELPGGGVRAGVAFYSALPGATPDAPDFLLSWR